MRERGKGEKESEQKGERKVRKRGVGRKEGKDRRKEVRRSGTV